MRLLRSLLLVAVLLGLGLLVILVVVFQTAPSQNSNETHFDTLIVLGTPARSDGTPSVEIRERVDEAVREYRAGVAPHVIMTGGAAHNRFVEGQVMADAAAAQGVPRSSIIVEGQAKDTIQNIWYSRQMMQVYGWHSAEVISSPYHLPRTALILGHYRGASAFVWRTHAETRPPKSSTVETVQHAVHEALGVIKLWLETYRHNPYLPNS